MLSASRSNRTFKSSSSAPSVLETVSVGLMWVVVVSVASVVSGAVVSASAVASVSASVAAVVVCAAEEAELLDSCLSLHPDSADSVRIPANRIESMDFPGRKFMI